MQTVIRYPGTDGAGFGLRPYAADLPVRREALLELSRPVAGVHDQRKRLPPELVTRALANDPFEDYPRAVCHYRRLVETDGVLHDPFGNSAREGMESFLRRLFPSLTLVPGISFAVGEAAKQPERRAFHKARARYQAAGLLTQTEQLTEAFDGLRALRLLFGSPAGQGSGRLEAVVPARYLPELLCAAPVWFIEAKGGPPAEARGARNSAIRYFCDLGKSDPFAYLFQLYNNRPRPFAEFAGEIMPLPLAELLGQVRGLFDYLVIATPYHDLASAEWGDPYWPPNIDPFLFGFLKQVPELVFCLGRWSGTGLFPLLGELLADTAAHLRHSRELLTGYGDGSAFAWYKAETVLPLETDVAGPALRPLKDYTYPKAALPRGWVEQERWKKQNHSLVRFSDRVVEHFEAGSLFPWLRGEGP